MSDSNFGEHVSVPDPSSDMSRFQEFGPMMEEGHSDNVKLLETNMY